MLMWQFHLLLSGFLANSHLSQVSHQSHLLDNDKGDNEVKSGAVHKFPSIYLAAEENSRKFRRLSAEGCVTSHCLKWGPFPPNDVSRVAQTVREEEGSKQ